MCGKYILAQAAKAELAMGIRRGRWEYPLSYRVLPSEQVPVVTLAVRRARGGDDALGPDSPLGGRRAAEGLDHQRHRRAHRHCAELP